LMASLLLAGAVVAPQNMFAEISLVSSPTEVQITENANDETAGFMVLTVGAQKYVVTAENNGLVAKPFDAALLSASKMVFKVDEIPTNIALTVGGQKVGLASGTAGWGTGDFTTKNSGFTSSIWLGSGTYSVNLSLDAESKPVFTPINGTSGSLVCPGCEVKFYNENSVEAVFAETIIGDNTLNEFEFGKYYLLMNADGQYLKAVPSVTDGYVTAEPAAFLVDDDPASIGL
ncbi:MAG: hypothetical protein LUD46_15735, partial [Parabacteroides sp.]|nr:hypothetical protein [Parabacteroides sp.]